MAGFPRITCNRWPHRADTLVMSTPLGTTSSTTSVGQYEAAKRQAALSGGTAPVSPGTQPAPVVTQGSVQAQQGAQQAQPKEEPFNAPMLDIPEGATTREVMAGLTKAMADPTVNASTARQLFTLHEQLMQAEKAMMQVIVDGMLI